MRGRLLRRRAVARALVLTVLVVGAVLAFAPPVLASGPTTLGRTGWQVSRPYDPVYTPFFPDHGDPGFYNYIPGPIPGATDASWSDCGPANALCQDADTVDMYMPYGSRLYGYPCLSSADFTFFQSLVSIPDGTDITQFSVNMSGADDGARVSIYNSSYPDGLILAGSYIQLVGGTGSTTDLSPYMVAGEVNRVLITQVDDCAVGNNLQYAQIFLNGTVIPPAPTDTTPPVDAPVVTPAANGNGWNNSDVTVNWHWTDSGSGIDPAHCVQSSTSAGEGALTLSSTCQDLAGNSASDSVTVNVDETAPVDAPVVSPAANGAGWNNSDVTVNWHWTDSGSGIDPAHCVQSSTSAGEGALTLSSTCQDLAGNSASDSVTVNVDKTAPVVSYSGNAGTYSLTQSVSITCSASDALSGVVSNTCANVSGPRSEERRV